MDVDCVAASESCVVEGRVKLTGPNAEAREHSLCSPCHVAARSDLRCQHRYLVLLITRRDELLVSQNLQLLGLDDSLLVRGHWAKLTHTLTVTLNLLILRMFDGTKTSKMITE